MRLSRVRQPALIKRLCLLVPAAIIVACLCCSFDLYGQTPLTVDDLMSVTFANDKEGWACGRWGTILHTADGGTSWTRQTTGSDYTLSAVFFVDTKSGWAVGDGGTIMHTKDGGNSWTPQKSPVPFFLMDVFFVSPTKGFIVTERTHILSTDDGGGTWKIQFKDEDYILKAISFCDAQNGWSGGEFGYIYRTKDGGATWQKQGGFSDLSEETGELIGGTYIFDIVAIDPNTAWAVGIDGYIAKTTDGGKTWQQVELKNVKAPLFAVAAGKSGGTLIAVGNGIGLGSEDSGRTWKKLEFKPPVTYGWLYGLSRRGNGSFVATGKEGAIYLGGLTGWERVSLQQASDRKKR
jgi:photosystem II stability/assembly factor-like uncharacterized protein